MFELDILVQLKKNFESIKELINVIEKILGSALNAEHLSVYTFAKIVFTGN